MDQESPGRQAWDAVAEIGRTLDCLKEVLQGLEPRGRAPAPAPSTTPSAVRGREAGTPLPASQQAALARFREILSIPIAAPEPAAVLGLSLDRLLTLTFVDRAAVFLLDREHGRLVPHVARGFRPADLIACAFAPGEGLVGRAFRERQPLVYQTPVDEPPADQLIARFPVRDAVALPIHAEGDVVGVLFAGRRGKPTPFTVEELQLMAVVADRIGSALVHCRIAERLGDLVYRMNELVELSTRVSVRHDIRGILSLACQAGGRLLHASASVIALRGEDGRFTVAASDGLSEEAVARWAPDTEHGITGELLRRREPLACPDLHVRPDDPALKALGIRALLVLPLRSRGDLIGGLYLVDSHVREFSPDEIESAKLLAGLAGLAIENDRLYRELRQAFDELTAAQERLIKTEKAQALEAMAGGVAHEFNNILAIIIGKMQLILGGIPDEQLRADLHVIEETAWRAAEVVRRLQRFTASRPAGDPVSLDLNSLVREAVDLTRARWKDEAEARGIKIEVVTDLTGTARLLGSPAELREMLLDLIMNALDALPDGGRLTLATRRRGDDVELSVADTGTGMSETVRRRLFDPFFTTRSPQRTGLGLSVVHGIVSRHHGTIEVESREGGGATFKIFFRSGSASGPPAPAASVFGEEGSAAPARILVIEDEEYIREMLEQMLLAAGHGVGTARDGLEGLARFRDGDYDVVITDLSIPERSGLEVTRAIKHESPEVPVILMTGWGDLLDPARLRENGVDFTLSKPFLSEQVSSVLADALRLRRTAR